MTVPRKKDEYPGLRQLLGELRQLDRAGVLEAGASRIRGGGKLRFTRGLQVGRLTWPGVGDFWLTREQQEVVAVLMEAYFECDNPDVAERTLLLAVGSKAAKLASVFADSDAWGRLVVQGRAPGTYRLATPAGTARLFTVDEDWGDADEEEEEQVEEGEPGDEWIR